MRSLLKWGALFAVAVISVLVAGIPHAHTALAQTTLDPTTLLFMGLTGVGATVPTLIDVAKRLDPSGAIAKVVEILNVTNEILTDMGWQEGNLPTGHRTTVRTGLPTVAWRLLNQGVTPSKSRTVQIDEQCAIMEAWAEVDVRVAKLNGNQQDFRFSEALAFIEAMNQTMATTLFYGNGGVSPEQFTGLSVRYSSLSAGNARNVLDALGTGSDQTSVWLVVWGPQTISGIYPKGSVAGLQHNDFGEVTIQAATGIGTTRLRAYQDQWVWDCGIAVRDWRAACRIANVDTTALIANTGMADLTNFMIKAHARVNTGVGRAAWYMNRTVFEMLDIQRHDAVKAGGQLNYHVVDGVNTPMFRGIPIRKTDALVNTETQVT